MCISGQGMPQPKTRPPLRCWLGFHRWRTFGSYVRGISLYEDQRCLRCGATRTLWNRERSLEAKRDG